MDNWELFQIMFEIIEGLKDATSGENNSYLPKKNRHFYRFSINMFLGSFEIIWFSLATLYILTVLNAFFILENITLSKELSGDIKKHSFNKFQRYLHQNIKFSPLYSHKINNYIIFYGNFYKSFYFNKQNDPKTE